MFHWLLSTTEFSRPVFQQTIGIPVVRICAPLLADFLLHAYGADFRKELCKNKDRELDQTFNSSFRFYRCHYTISDLLIYVSHLLTWIKGYYWHSKSDSDLYLEIDNGGRFKNKTVRQTWWLHFFKSQHPFPY